MTNPAFPTLDWKYSDVERVSHMLDVINPKMNGVETINRMVEKAAADSLGGYVSTGGWLACWGMVGNDPNATRRYLRVTQAPYSVACWAQDLASACKLEGKALDEILHLTRAVAIAG